jgi:low temperature requirement protein LtrA
MSTAGSARTATEGGDLPEHRVTPLELFFDLVFVFALTQVTGFLADHLTWVGMLQGDALLVVLWWAYFDLVMLVAERRLSAAKGEERARLARDSYSYLHLPMVAGIVLVALGIKKTMAHVGDPLGTTPAVALCGGVALYLIGHNAFRLRDVGSVSVPRLVVTVLCCALVPMAVSAPSLVILAILALLLCALAAFETMRSREFRRDLVVRGRPCFG